MSRNDGRPRSVGTLSLDPLPFVHRCIDDGTCPFYGKRMSIRGVNNELEPRSGFIQDDEAYL